MTMIYKIGIIVFIALIFWFFLLELKKRRKLNIERYSLVLIVRTEKGKEVIKKLSKFKRFWKIVGNIGILTAFIGMIAIFLFIYSSLYSKYILRKTIGGVMPVIPGVTIPFWYGIFALCTVIIVHEFAHGVIARCENIKIKNLGVVLLTSIPIGAFVEPNEEELKKSNLKTKLRVYSAGSFANLFLALISIGIILGFYSFFISQSVEIINVVEDSPAYGILEEGMVIKSINGIKINSMDEFREIATNLKPGDTIIIKTNKGTFKIKTGKNPKNPDRGYIGIIVTSPLKEGMPGYVYMFLYWVFLLNQGIGLINLAPIHFGVAATDGYYILKEVLSRLISYGNAEKIAIFISATNILAILSLLIH